MTMHSTTDATTAARLAEGELRVWSVIAGMIAAFALGVVIGSATVAALWWAV